MDGSLVEIPAPSAPAAAGNSVSSRSVEEALARLEEEQESTGQTQQSQTQRIQTLTFTSPEFHGTKGKILSLLEAVDSPGEFCSHVVDETPCNPGLLVTNYGEVGLPILHRDLTGLMHLGEQRRDVRYQDIAAFGTGSLKMCNPQWRASLNKHLEDFKKRMGLHRSVDAGYPALVVCRPGADISPYLQHRNAETTFAKLLITLGGCHTGSSLSVTYDGGAANVPLEHGHQYGSVLTLWLLDADFTWEPSKAGHFAALLFDIVRPSQSIPTIPPALEAVPKLREALHYHFTRTGPSHPRMLAFCIPRLVATGCSIRSTLSSRDRCQISRLQKSCAANRYCLYLARLKRTVVGQRHGMPSLGRSSVTGHLDDKLADGYRLVDIETLTGDLVCHKASFYPECLIQSDVYNSRRIPEFVNFRHQPQDGTNLVEVCYENAVILIMSPEDELDFVAENSHEFAGNEQVDSLRQAYQATREDLSNTDKANHFLTLCKTNVRSLKERPEPVHFGEVMVVTMTKTLSSDLDRDRSAVLLDLLSLLEYHRIEFVFEMIMIIMWADWKDVADLLEQAFLRLPDAVGRLNMMLHLSDNSEYISSSKRFDIISWVEAQLNKEISALPVITQHERQVVLQALLRFKSTTILDTVLSKTEHLFPIDSCLWLFERLIESQGTSRPGIGQESESVLREQGHIVMNTFVPRLAKRMLEFINTDAEISADKLIDLINDILIPGSMLIIELLAALLKFRGPLLSQLLPQALTYAEGLDSRLSGPAIDGLQNFITGVLTNFYIHEVGEVPQRKIPVIRKGYCCPTQCPDCMFINTFLLDPYRRVFQSFLWSELRCDHILSHLHHLGSLKLELVAVSGCDNPQLRITKIDPTWEASVSTWHRNRHLYLDTLGQISQLRAGMLEGITKDKFGILMTESLLAMQGIAFRRDSATCLVGTRFYLFCNPPYPGPGLVEDIAELITSHGGVAVTAVGPLLRPDIVVVVGTMPSKDAVREAFGPTRRVIDRNGLLHLIQTSQLFNPPTEQRESAPESILDTALSSPSVQTGSKRQAEHLIESEQKRGAGREIEPGQWPGLGLYGTGNRGDWGSTANSA
ncbi:hypothetical protein A1O3_00973 [Capronia epimyces CBS 606.96]|uniref:Uncharacterized protein n=1 Tax=Capronia epimyces CBS 606.96 TaxID=1182542 RepID=W9YHS8_9EURO|nr:uncharacterized protein A1O3_00973 [Capronia epimyces CBS 606.96]EXJ92422.1 hypothetical protein A1O3_00973 [Capronia epimyces CBS 606.96]